MILFLITLHVLGTAFAFPQRAPQPGAPTGLMVELLRWPEDAVITDPEPEFSWIVNDVRHGAVQSAYQILVSGSEEMAEAETGDIWDSGRVSSDRSVAVSYAGPALAPHRSVWWRVRTWDADGVASPFSEAQRFRTGSFDRSGEAFPGASAWVLLPDGRWVLENRQRADYHEVAPIEVVQQEDGTVVADFGRAAFATLKVRMTSPAGGEPVVVYLGERRTEDGRVHKHPGRSNIGFTVDTLVTMSGTHWYPLQLPRHVAHYPNSQVLPDLLPEVAPFRYVELVGLPGSIGQDDLRQLALLYPFDDDRSAFSGSDPALGEVWQLCKYTLKATPFLSLYCDGNRERMPYEADAYIQQLGHYNVDREYAVARYTNQFLLHNASWPTEWHLHTVLAAWADYLYTGDGEFLRGNYDLLRRKTLIDLADDSGLVSTRTGRATPEILATLNYAGDGFRDIVDWPHGTPAGAAQASYAGPSRAGETDGFVFTDFNAVVNAFHYRALVLMAEIARALDRTEEARFFTERAGTVFEAFNRAFFDEAAGVYVDGIGTSHASLHANLFPLAFGLVPPDRMAGVVSFVKSRGMACSVYGAQHLLEGLYNAGEAEYALSLMTDDGVRSWRNMLRVGSTMTTEAWDESFKPNLTWNHAWGAAPGNIIPRRLMGVEPLAPGFAVARIRPQPGGLDSARVQVPTIRGPITVAWFSGGDGYRLEVTIPANMEAEVWLPGSDPARLSEGERRLDEVDDVESLEVRDGWTVVRIGAGGYAFSGTHSGR